MTPDFVFVDIIITGFPINELATPENRRAGFRVLLLAAFVASANWRSQTCIVLAQQRIFIEVRRPVVRAAQEGHMKAAASNRTTRPAAWAATADH